METWQEAAEKNTLPRINWADILGDSLPIFVFYRLRQKKTTDEIEAEIVQKYYAPNSPNNFPDLEEIKRIVKINVGARAAEFERFKSVMHGSLKDKMRCGCGNYAQHKLDCGVLGRV